MVSPHAPEDEAITPKAIFLASLARCTERADFPERFYSRFCAASDDVREMFRDTDFKAQNRALLKSLKLIAAATCGDRAGLRELRERAATHDRHHLNIRPELYQLWLDAMITTAAECDPDWSDGVELAWWRILGFVVRFMTARYEGDIPLSKTHRSESCRRATRVEK